MAARTVTYTVYTTPSSSLLYDPGSHTLKQRRMNHLVVTIILYKVINGLFPIHLCDIFQNTSQVHSHELRGSDINLFILRLLSEAQKHSFQYQGATLWDSLPIQAKNRATLTSFEVSLPA